MKIALILSFFAAILALIIGWVMNLITVISLAMSDAPVTTGFIVRIVGVPIAIIGGIAGWL